MTLQLRPPSTVDPAFSLHLVGAFQNPCDTALDTN